MITFKEYLAEAIFKTMKDPDENYQILINPTPKELGKENSHKWMATGRGFIDLKGNVYLVYTNTTMLHEAILKLLSIVLPIKPNNLTKTFKEIGGVPITRSDFNTVQFSETSLYWFKRHIDDTEKTKANLDFAKKIFDKAKKKNSTMKFNSSPDAKIL